MHPISKSAPANQPHAIRAKNRFWRARMRREAGSHEKFFYCQNPRLRVRATSFLPASSSRYHIDRASIAECVNKRNTCGAGISFDTGNDMRRVLARRTRHCDDILACR
jgi:hypothetical protein